jgi:hypothetical protein
VTQVEQGMCWAQREHQMLAQMEYQKLLDIWHI